MQINWTLLTYIVVGVFILGGFSSGWWKEAIVTFFLGVMVFLLQDPALAQKFIDQLNAGLTRFWQILPASVTVSLAEALTSGRGSIQANAGSSGTWLTILLVGVVLATQIGRLALPSTYALTAVGRLLGGTGGGVNGLLIVNLVREYLDGRSLPGHVASGVTAGVQVVGGSAYGDAATAISVQAGNLPNATILDSAAPWIIIIGGVLLLAAALLNSVTVQTNAQKMRKISYRKPFGYR
jgi:hypothetical protein